MRAKTWWRLSVVVALFSMSAFADHGDNKNNNNDSNSPLTISIIGSVPSTTIGGIKSGGAPWTMREGKASISEGGKLKVEVAGLLIGAAAGVPANVVGTVGSVLMVAASLVCGGSGGAVVASTGGVPLSSGGNAEIEKSVSLPASCMAPVILVRVFSPSAPTGSQLGAFIAVSGFTSTSVAAKDNDLNDQ